LVHTVTYQPTLIGRDLTKREREILELVATGWTNEEIAERLMISPSTVKFHVRIISSKLDTCNRIETIVVAINNHLVPASA